MLASAALEERRSRPPRAPGEMAERSKAHAWKACVGQPTVGSNPTLSAIESFYSETSSPATPRTATPSAQVETSQEGSRVAAENAAVPRGFARSEFGEANRGDWDSRIHAAPFGGFLCWRVRRFAFAVDSVALGIEDDLVLKNRGELRRQGKNTPGPLGLRVIHLAVNDASPNVQIPVDEIGIVRLQPQDIGAPEPCAQPEKLASVNPAVLRLRRPEELVPLLDRVRLRRLRPGPSAGTAGRSRGVRRTPEDDRFGRTGGALDALVYRDIRWRWLAHPSFPSNHTPLMSSALRSHTSMRVTGRPSCSLTATPLGPTSGATCCRT